MCVCVLSHISCNPMDYSLPGSSIHGILQAQILEWGAISSRESYPPKDQTYVSYVSWISRQGSFPGGSEVKASACNAGDLVLLPGESQGRRSLVGCVHGIAKSRRRLSDFTSLECLDWATSLLPGTWFTILYSLRVCSKVIRFYRYLHLLFSAFFFHLGYYRISSGVSCAVQ